MNSKFEFHGLTDVQLQTFTGILRLDNRTREARLEQATQTGVRFTTLMQLGVETAEFNPARVAAAWKHFAVAPGLVDGCEIRVRGFASQFRGSGRPILHVSGEFATAERLEKARSVSHGR